MKYLKFTPVIILSVFILVSLGFNVAAIWNQVTIPQIQTKSPDSLAVGKDKSDMLGDSVEFVARVIASPRVSPSGNDQRTLLRGTSSWTCYVQDTTNNLFGGIVIRQGSRGPATLLDQIDTGQVIRVRGRIEEFWGTNQPGNALGFLTQLALDTAVGYTITPIGAPSKRPEPKLVNVSDFATGDYANGGTINYLQGEKYEGMYVELRNVTVAAGVGNRQPWSVVDAQGNKLYFRDFSNFFTTDPAQRLDTSYTHPGFGTVVNYIRGVIINANNEGAFGNQVPYAIVPIYPNDVSLSNTPPIISNPSRNPGVPTPNDNPLITCSITDDGTITSAQILYRINRGSYSTVNLTPAGNIFSGTIPAQPLNTLVEYIIRAQDNTGGVRILPNDSARGKLFYFVKQSDSLSIQDVQYTPNNSGISAYSNFDVRGVEGIVTADTSDIRNFSFSGNGGSQTSPRRVYIQNGTGPWSGIWISGNPTDALRRGDRVRVKGTVEENFGVTRINISTPSNIVVLSSNNTVPDPVIVNSGQIPNSAQDGDSLVERYESMLIRFNFPVAISCINAGVGLACTTPEPLPDTTFRRNFGEILVQDFSNVASRIELQGGNHNYSNNWDGLGNVPPNILLTKNDSISFVQGILYFSFSNWKTVPRRPTDFGTVTPVGITYNPEVIQNYTLNQNYPNPFNPSTRFAYSLPVNANVTLKIYDMIGREVSVLVNQFNQAGSYIIDFNASHLASGVYFYKLEALGVNGTSFSNTKRMVLIK
ncbi:MAG TPA: T9SS type A sorting domain-containing protein [Ignavibacteria bacterium]|nr:T9SS type A sorting domain-containing protein [Ignavibacteria bacterium]